MLIYSANGELGEAPARADHVDDQGGRGRRRVPDGKVVKTTTFGAFVELAKGTDGLLHISNVSPGQRVDTVEDVLNKGDEIKVRVVEVDRERGRIGLRLADDPEIAGKSVEELAGGRRRRRQRRRPAVRATAPRPRPRPGGAAATAARAAPAARATAPAATAMTQPCGDRAPADRAGLGRPGRHGAHGLACDPWRSGFWIGTGSVGRGRATRPACRTWSSTCCSAGTARYESLRDRPAVRRDGRRAQRRHRQGDDVGLHARDRRAPRPRRSTSWPTWSGGRASPPSDLDNERQIVLEEIAMYEDDPQDKVFDVLGEAVFGDHPLGRPIIGRAEVVAAIAADGLRGVPRSGATCPRNVVIAAAGSVDHDALVEIVRAAEASAPAARRAGAAAPPGRAPARTLLRRARTPSRSTSASARPGSRATTTAASRCACSTTIFGGTSSSRLFQEVREQRGLAYAVYSFQSLYASTGQVGLYLGTRPDNVGEALQVVGRRARALRARARDRRRARSAPRRTSRAGIVLSLESTSARMNRLGSSRAGRPAAADRRRGGRAHRRGHARATSSSSRPSCSRPSG